MRALSVRQPWAELIADGRKSIEVRSWSTNYRGPLAIVASLGVHRLGCSDFGFGTGSLLGRGCVIAVCDLVDVREGRARDKKLALFDTRGYLAWVLKNVRRCEPLPVKGKLSLWHIDDRLVVPLRKQA